MCPELTGLRVDPPVRRRSTCASSQKTFHLFHKATFVSKHFTFGPTRAFPSPASTFHLFAHKIRARRSNIGKFKWLMEAAKPVHTQQKQRNTGSCGSEFRARISTDRGSAGGGVGGGCVVLSKRARILFKSGGREPRNKRLPPDLSFLESKFGESKSSIP